MIKVVKSPILRNNNSLKFYISDKLQIFPWHFLPVMAPGPSMAPALGGLCLHTTHSRILLFSAENRKYLDFGERTNCSDYNGLWPMYAGLVRGLKQGQRSLKYRKGRKLIEPAGVPHSLIPSHPHFQETKKRSLNISTQMRKVLVPNNLV